MVSPPAGGGDARRRQEGESDGHAMPPSDWNALTDDIQLALSREAMRRAAETLAEHAELLAAEIEHGGLSDRGGPDALRLFAAVVRATQQDAFGPVGRA
jgi:Mor family transcriptional regulator